MALGPIPVPKVFPLQEEVDGTEIIQNCLDPTGAYFTTEQLAEYVETIIPPGGNPGGTNGQIQYNDAGAFGGLTVGTGLTVVGDTLEATGANTPPGGSSGQLQYNNSGSFGGYGVGSGLSVVGGNLTATGGSVTGLPSVTSIAALQALNSTTSPVAYLDLGGRSGIFVWSGADHSVDVANDPGQGEWIALTSTNTFTVSGTLSPNVAGTYVASGIFAGNEYYEDVGVGFLWYFAGGTEWVISVALGDTAHQVWVSGSGSPSTPHIGTYSPFNGGTGTATVAILAGPGATGAWQRQWSGTCDWAWWGAIADTVCTVDPLNYGTSTVVISGTDNGQSFLNWQTWAQHKSAFGFGVYVEPSYGVTGVYGWNLNTTGFYWIKGIKKLHINGRKMIVMQQLLNGAGSIASFPVGNDVQLSVPTSTHIQTTRQGDIFFTCNPISSASLFTKGIFALLTSLDIQHLGYNPNVQNFEYRLVLNNGVIYGPVAISSAVYTTGTGALALTFALPPFGTASTTSSTSNTIGLGSLTFVVPLTLSIPVGQAVTVTATSGNTMTGNVVSYDGVTTGNLVISVVSITGSGTFASWTVAFTVLNLVGQWLTLDTLGGTGSFASLDGAWRITSITGGGLAVTVAATAGLTATVTSGNASSGVVPLAPTDPIQYMHMSTYPDYSLAGNFPAGQARAWLMGTAWDAEHIYEKIEVRLPPGCVGNFYSTFSIRQTTTIDWVGAGASEVTVMRVIHIRPKFKAAGETDKMNIEIDYFDADLPTINLATQSASPKIMNVIGGQIAGFVSTPQKLLCQGVNINGPVTLGPQFGFGESVVFENCVITGTWTPANVMDGTANPGLAITAGGVTYANGTFTIDLSTIGFGITAWSVVPGMFLMLEGLASDGQILTFTGDAGALMVLGLRSDNPTSPTMMFIDTNGPAALPTWCLARPTPNARLMHLGTAEFRKCTGQDSIRNASDATDNGKQYYEWYRNIISGSTISFGGTTYPYFAGNYEFGINGFLTSFECEVVLPHPTSGAALNLQFFSYIITPSAITRDYIFIKIDVSVAGKRIINTSSFTGAAGVDSLQTDTLAAGIQPIPPNHMCFLAGGTMPAPSNSVFILVKTLIQTDCSMARRQLPAQNFGVNAVISSIVLPLQGMPQ